MRRRIAAFALFAVLLVTAAPAVGNHELAVGSIHTTDGELSSATELTNVVVEGSGTGASAVLQRTDTYNPYVAEGSGTRDSETLVGDSSGDIRFFTQVRITPDFSGPINQITPNFASADGNSVVPVDVYISAGQPDSEYGEGTLVKEDWTPSFATGPQTINLDQSYTVSQGQNYSIEFMSSTDNDGTRDVLDVYKSGGTAYQNAYRRSYGVDTPVAQEAGAVDIEVSTGAYVPPSGSYVSSTHSVEGAENGFTDLTLQNAEATVRWEYYDGSSWQVANSATYTSSGNHSLDISGHPSATQWRVDVSFDRLSGSTTAQLHDEGVQFFNHAPTVTNPEPSGGDTITGGSPTLSVDVADADFSLAQGDSVTAEFYLDGSLVDTQTTSFNDTLEYQPSSFSGGSHTWHVELSDEYGHSVTSSTWSFAAPDAVKIYNESAPSTLIQSPTEVTVQFFAENGSTYTRSTTNGTIPFGGLPVNQEFTVTAEADGYRSRTMTIESLVQQSDVYLLPESVPAANVVYSLIDNTGTYSPPEETTLYIEKPLTISGSTKYQTITSSAFSATNEIPVFLENGQRYRLRLEGPQHNTRVLGSYTTAGDDAANLIVGQVTFGGASASNPSFTSSVTTIDGTRVLEIKYYDPANATDALTIGVTNRTSGATFRPTTTETGPFGTYREIIPISSSKEYVSYNVTYTAHRSDYADQNGTIFTGDLPKIAQELGLDPRILAAFAYLIVLSTLGLFAISSPRFSGIPTAVVAFGLVGFGAVAIHPLVLSGVGVMAVLFAIGGGVR